MRKRAFKYSLLMCCLLVHVSVYAAEVGTLLKPESLQQKPFRDAPMVGKLAAGTKLEIVAKQGGWLQVKAGKNTGWVKMLSVRKGDAAAKSTSNDVAALAGVASGRSGTGKIVATTGIRGLNEEELKAAEFNDAELKQLETYSVSRADAAKFASVAKLKVRKMDYLPEAGGR